MPVSSLRSLTLTPAQRAALSRIIDDPLASPYQLNRAKVLLLADGVQRPLLVQHVAHAAGVSRPTVFAILKDSPKALRAVLADLSPRGGSRIKRPVLSPPDRAALQRIADRLHSWSTLGKRARLLLLAADDSFPLRFHRLTRTAGVTRPTVYSVLCDPDASVREVVKAAHRPRDPEEHFARPIKARPRLNGEVRAILKRLSADVHAGALRRKRATVLLVASHREQPGIEGICEKAGVGPGTVKNILRGANATLRSLMGYARRRPAQTRTSIRGRPPAPFPAIKLPPIVRAALRNLADDPHERTWVVKRARLLLAAENPGKRTRQQLARDIGLVPDVVSGVLRAPERALRKLLDHTRNRRAALMWKYGPALKESGRAFALLKRIAGDASADELVAKRARVLLCAAQQGESLRITRVAAAAGVAYQTARDTLRNHQAVLDELKRVYEKRGTRETVKRAAKSKIMVPDFARGKPANAAAAKPNPGAAAELARLEGDLIIHPLVRARARAVMAAAGKDLDQEGKRSLALQLGMDYNFFRRSLELYWLNGIAGLFPPGQRR